MLVTIVDIVFVTIAGTVFVKFVETLSVTFIVSSHTITDLIIILFKYLLFS